MIMNPQVSWDVPSIVALNTLTALAALLESLGWSRYCMLCLELIDLWSSSAKIWKIMKQNIIRTSLTKVFKWVMGGLKVWASIKSASLLLYRRNNVSCIMDGLSKCHYLINYSFNANSGQEISTFTLIHSFTQILLLIIWLVLNRNRMSNTSIFSHRPLDPIVSVMLGVVRRCASITSRSEWTLVTMRRGIILPLQSLMTSSSPRLCKEHVLFDRRLCVVWLAKDGLLPVCNLWQRYIYINVTCTKIKKLTF